MLWARSWVLWAVAGGVPRSSIIGSAQAADIPTADFMFAQVSDSQIGFHAPANPDVKQTFQHAVRQVAALNRCTAMLIHSGDVSYLGKDEELDTAQRILHGAGMDAHVIPSEHDMLLNHGQGFYRRFSPKDAEPLGAYTFDDHGAHLIALNNVSDFRPAGRPGGLGRLGAGQMAWLKADLQGRSASEPIVVLAHMPLWSVYPRWGWGTDESAELLAAWPAPQPQDRPP
jgi:3',5'-cyclic AMP phosphodiesterase CpdA